MVLVGTLLSVSFLAYSDLAYAELANKEESDEIPASIAPFFAARFDEPKLSPDGKHIAVIRTVEGHDFVEVFRLEDSKSINTFRFQEGQGVAGHDWLDERSIVVHIRNGLGFFFAFPSGSVRFDIETKENERMWSRVPFPLMTGRLGNKIRLTRYADFIIANAFEGNNNLRAMLSADVKETYAYSYQPGKERYTKLAEIPGQAFNTYSDREGNVLAVWGHTPEKGARDYQDQMHLLYRSDASAEFKTAKTAHIDDFDVYLIAAGPKKDTLYILEDSTGDTLALSIFDLKDGSIKPIFRPARTDLIRTYLDGDRQLYAVRYDDHFPQFHYPNPKLPAAIAHKSLSTRFKNKNVEMTDFAKDNSKAVVLVSSDNEPGQYFVLDFETKKLGTLLDRAPQEAKLELGSRNPIEFKANDGTRLTGYLSLPKGHTSPPTTTGRLPLIVLPHDERFSEAATWGYRMQAQLFNVNGFAVLEVNPRGVIGFGRKFYDAGVGGFGDVRLDDIAAGVDFVVASKTADPDKVCIVGRRWGAHAAFMSAIRRPDKYQCVVTIFGKYDVTSDRRNAPMGQFRDRFTARLAGDGASEKDVEAMSPHLLTDQLKPPLLIVEARQHSLRLSPEALKMTQELGKGNSNWEMHEESTKRTNNLLTDHNRGSAYGRIIEFAKQHTQ